MPKVRTTLTVDEEVLRAVRAKAARTGMGDSQVIEESLRRDLGLDALEQLWADVRAAPEAEGIQLADAELHEMRGEGRAPRGP